MKRKLPTLSFDIPDNNQDVLQNNKNQARKSILKWITILGIVLATVIIISTNLLEPIMPSEYVRYLQVAEVAVIGYFIIHVIGTVSHRMLIPHSEQTAKSIQSLIRIAGAIIVVAFIISYLSQDPVIAGSISTISGLVIGFAASNLIGNAIAGIYLAITRPFKIVDRITAHGNTGTVSEIGLLYTTLSLDNGDTALCSNTSLVTTTIVLLNQRDSDRKSHRSINQANCSSR